LEGRSIDRRFAHLEEGLTLLDRLGDLAIADEDAEGGTCLLDRATHQIGDRTRGHSFLTPEESRVGVLAELPSFALRLGLLGGAVSGTLDERGLEGLEFFASLIGEFAVIEDIGESGNISDLGRRRRRNEHDFAFLRFALLNFVFLFFSYKNIITYFF